MQCDVHGVEGCQSEGCKIWRTITTDIDIWQSIAARNGCEYRGHQDIDGQKLPLFADLQTGSSFHRESGETVGDALARIRGKFKEVNHAQI